MVLIWYMDETNSIRQLLHNPEPTVYRNIDSLQSIGVLYWQLTSPYENHLKQIRQERHYDFTEEIIISKDLQQYERMTNCYYEEHIHANEQARLILEGSGYFDVRDEQDKWLRMFVETGDFIVIPAGIYHRFTCDTNDFIKMRRFHQKHPVWVGYKRSENAEDKLSRMKYVEKFGLKKTN